MTYFSIAAFYILLTALVLNSKMVYITRVLDGDTVEALWRGRVVKIRLAGIDAPESTQKGGKQATKNLERLCLNKWFTMSGIKADRYGRIVAVLGGTNAEQVRSGHAFSYMSKAYAQLEQKAKQAKLLVHRLDIKKPWDYRKSP